VCMMGSGIVKDERKPRAYDHMTTYPFRQSGESGISAALGLR
jgi:hypothetical protein